MTSRSAEPPHGHRVAALQPEFRVDLQYWVRTDRTVALRVLELVDAVLRAPFEGIGKPEPLRFPTQGCWSRRITQKHRLVHRASETRVDFLQARDRY